jgi:putative ABC transport system ATP-binding protein
MTPLLECVDICHTFGCGEVAEEVIRGVSACFTAGETCVLMGPSGSGKTTLLSILGCLLTPSGGQLLVEGAPVDYAAPGALTRLRREKIGFVFQAAQLLPFLSVVENLELAGRNAGLSLFELSERITELLEQLGMTAHRHKRPDHLSGGQRQRLSIARALLHRPPILLADEPTAALDWHHGEAAVRLLVEQARTAGALLLTVTHDIRLVPLFGRHLLLQEGRLNERLPT